MKMLLRKKKRKVNILFICIIIFIFLVVVSGYFVNYYSKKAIPLLMSYAEAESKKLIILVINKAVTKQINNVDTDQIFEVTYNNNGEVILVDFNSKRTSIALSTITSLVEVNLRAIEEGKIELDAPVSNYIPAFADAYTLDENGEKFVEQISPKTFQRAVEKNDDILCLLNHEP